MHRDRQCVRAVGETERPLHPRQNANAEKLSVALHRLSLSLADMRAHDLDWARTRSGLN